MAREKSQGIDEAASTTSLINHVEIEVEAFLGETLMTVAQLHALSEGDVIKLNRQINEPVSIRVNGRIIGHGEIVTVNDCFAVRVTQIGE